MSHQVRHYLVHDTIVPLRGRAREALLLAEVEPQRFEPPTRFPFREG